MELDRRPVVIALVIATALVSRTAALHAQSEHKRLEFGVASVKPHDPNSRLYSGRKVYPGGRIVLSRNSLKGLLIVAFRLSPWQLSGGEAWTLKDEYEIEALPPRDLQPPITNLRYTNWWIEDERLCEMLQSLLIERFHLQFHRETKTGKVYLLEKSGKTLRLQPSSAEFSRGLADSQPDFSGDIGFAGGRYVLFNVAMPQLARLAAANILRAPVVDKTGLNGSFDYRQPARLLDSEVDYSNPPFIPLLSEVGLKVTATQGPVETFVIDHAEKPSEN